MDSTQPKPFVFVLMPFAREFNDVFQLGIRAACHEAGGYCERVDEQIFEGSILERIYNQINKADLVVADMTGRNPNVFYEVGYAHALGKKVILLTQKSEDIPFDLKHYPHIVYGGEITELKNKLIHNVSWYFRQAEPTQVIADSFADLEYYLGGQLLSEGAEILLGWSDVRANKMDIFLNVNTSISIHNPTNKLRALDFGIGLIFPEYAVFPGFPGMKDTRLPDGRLMNGLIRIDAEIMPFGWESTSFYANFPWERVWSDSRFPVVMRFFTPEGTKDISFSMRTPNLGP